MVWWLGSLVSTLAFSGELTGTVVDTAGQPVADVYVVAFDRRMDYTVTTTDEQGEYAITGLNPGPHRLRVIPTLEQNLAEQWTPGTLEVCAAHRYPLPSSDSVDTVDVTLGPGGRAFGWVEDDEGNPLVGVEVIAATTGSVAKSIPRSAFTDADGRFELLGLPPENGLVGEWRVQLLGPDRPSQYMPGVYEAVDADSFEVAPEDEVDLGVMSLLSGITVNGTVYGPDGPVASGDVHVYSPSSVVTVPVTSEGTYRAVGLPPGEVLSWYVEEGYALTYYPDSDRPDARVSMPDEGGVVDSMDLTVPYEQRLVGQLVADGDLSGASVLAYNDTRTVGVGGGVEADGEFSVGRLHPGTYTLQVYAEAEGYLTAFALGEDGDPREFVVPEEGDSEWAEIELEAGAVLSGQVTDEATGEPVYGAMVMLEPVEGVGLEVGVTDRDGVYSIRGIRAGEWGVRVEYSAYCADDPSWVTKHYADEVYAGNATTLYLDVGQERDWSPSMPQDMDQDQMGDAWELANGLDPELRDADRDPDGDGYTNLEEYYLGTDPQVAEGAARRCGCSAARDPVAGGLLVFYMWGVLVVCLTRRESIGV